MKFFTLALILLSTIYYQNAYSNEEIKTVDHVEVEKYLGKWYSISALPQFYTRDCKAQSAEYTLLDESKIALVNYCHKEDGSLRDIKGIAYVINPQTNAELMIKFDNFWTKLFMVKGDYNILKIDNNYSTVLIGSKNKKSLWLMARSTTISDQTKKEYLTYAKELGYDISKLIDSNF